MVFLGVGAKDEPQNLEYCSNHLFRYASKCHVRKWDIIIQVVGDDHPKDLCQNALQSHCRAGKCINRGRAAKRHTVHGEGPADGQKCATYANRNLCILHVEGPSMKRPARSVAEFTCHCQNTWNVVKLQFFMQPNCRVDHGRRHIVPAGRSDPSCTSCSVT